jgi:hypothetical protein
MSENTYFNIWVQIERFDPETCEFVEDEFDPAKFAGGIQSSAELKEQLENLLKIGGHRSLAFYSTEEIENITQHAAKILGEGEDAATD